MDEAELLKLSAVEKAFEEGKEQAERYRTALVKRHGEELKLRSYVVVAVGLERLLFEETSPDGDPHKKGGDGLERR